MNKLILIFALMLLISCSSNDEKTIEPIVDETLYQYWSVTDVLINDAIWGTNNGYYFDIYANGKIKLKDAIGETELTYTWKRSDNGYNDSIITPDRNRCYKIWYRVSNYKLGLQHTIKKGSRPEIFLYSSRSQKK